VPGPETWEMILNGSTAQWGIESEYTDAVRRHELGRTIVAAGSSREYIEAFSILVEPGDRPADVVLVLRWETTVLRIPVTGP